MIHRSCQSCRSDFTIPDEDLLFFKKISPVFNGRQFDIPPPTHCPDCRLQRRLAARNEFSYYSRKCSCCGKNIISVHSENKPYPVYCHGCWWSEKWDPLAYGLEWDSSRGFFEQFAELQARVPQLAMMNDNGVSSENCEYCQDFSFSKNCYLVTASWEDRDCLFSTQCNQCRDCLETFVVQDCELTYESIFSQKLYACSHLMFSSNCNNCHFGSDLKGCSNCFCCVGLRQKEYCIFNQQYSAQQYKMELEKYKTDSRSGVEFVSRQFAQFLAQFPKKAVHQTNCEDCLGDSLSNCKNFHGFGFVGGENCRYGYMGDTPTNSYDIINTGRPDWCYEGATPDNSYMTHFTVWCWKDKYVLYSDNCHSSEHLFGCTGIRQGKHCILNRSYSPQEYEIKVAQIIERMQRDGEWGEFFPMTRSLFAYNGTRAHEVFPLTKEQSLSKNLIWYESDPREFKESTYSLPDAIADVPDSVVSELLACSLCRKNYKLTRQELAFYRTANIPAPHNCPTCRRIARFSLHSASGKLFSTTCGKCSNKIDSIYPPTSDTKVYCEPCYLETVYHS